MSKFSRNLTLTVLLATFWLNVVEAGLIHPITEHISYQGKLEQGGNPVTGTIPMTFRVWSEAIDGGQTGDTLVESVEVNQGLFQVELDFGNIFGSEAKWLEIEVDGLVLEPRQRIIAAPLALTALSVINAPLTSRWSATTGGIHYSSGQVGIGTSTPAATLQVVGSAMFGDEDSLVGGSQSFIGGGLGAIATGNQSFTGGGIDPRAMGHQSFVGGGVGNDARGTSSFVGGGRDNVAEGPRSFVGGGRDNEALGSQSFVAGGRYNCAGGLRSWAGGHRAKVRPGFEPVSASGSCFGLPYPGGNGDEGTFIWADSTDENFVSTGPGQFLVRASGGMGINTNQPEAGLHVAGDGELLLEGSAPRVSFFRPGVDPFVSQNWLAIAANGTLLTHVAGSTRMTVTNAGNVGIGVISPTFQLQLSADSAFKPGTNTWTTSSDERLKTDIEALDGALGKLLALRGVSFRWRDPEAHGGLAGQQMGLIAQEVEAVFPQWVGEDATGYKTLSVGGFEGLVAEALRELRAEKDLEIADLHRQLERQRDDFEARLTALEGLLRPDR
jgi:hypothetical protein